MVHEDKLSSVLSEFARTMVTDFPIQGILDHLVRRIVEVLPVSAAGVTVISGGKAPHYVAASDASALRYEQLQSDLAQGPCVAANRTGESISIPDLSVDDRFPDFALAAGEAGLAAVFTFPLRHGDGSFGALDLYRDTPADLDPHDMSAAQTLADVAAAYLLNAQAREEALAASDSFHHSALHDPLTGLPNRLLLRQRLEHAARRATRSHTNAAILFADLDRFKDVNDSHGHHVGDELLRAVAHRLAGLVRPGDTLARVSGDEFVFLCEDLSCPADVELLARRIGEALANPFTLAGIVLSVSASVGMAFAGPGEEISDELVVRADKAMYEAKRRGVGRRIIDLRQSLGDGPDTLELDLRAAVANDLLDLAYQPIVRCSDGVVTGVEALLRWTHADFGVVPASSMIKAAERSDLISEIGEWVLARSCRERSRWLRELPGAPLDVAVNVSAHQLIGFDFCDTVERILSRTGMDPKALVLEVTENVFVEDSERILAVLHDLKSLGIRLALDDFGTGFSSLSYLRRLPIDIVKIDQGFIADIDGAPVGGAIVAAVTNLAHVLGLSVIAEGVETAKQRQEISAMGCEAAQGYFFARPMSGAAIRTVLGRTTAGPLRLPAVARNIALAG